MMTSLEQRVEFLRNDTVLASLSVAQLRKIGKTMTDFHASEGTLLFERGQVADFVYLIVDGLVLIEIEKVPLLTRSRGEFIGEVAILDEGPRSASAVAQTDVQLLKWNLKEFSQLLKNAQVSHAFHRALSSKLRQDLPLQVEAAAVQQDLRRAREIQKAMLPSEAFASSRVELSGACHPCHDVGGDFYDYFQAPSGDLGVLICDVQGHGFYSALLVSLVKGAFKIQQRFSHEPPEILQSMDDAVALSTGAGGLMSCCYLVFNGADEQLQYTNAGHPPPYLLDAKTRTLAKLDSTDMILGVPDLVREPFATRTTAWRTSDVLVLYSDGVTEARLPTGEFFGTDRLEHIIREHGDEPASGVRDAILNGLFSSAGRMNEEDDVTVVVVKAR